MRVELEELGASSTDDRGSEGSRSALSYLDLADAAAEDKRTDDGWEYANAAQRAMTMLRPDDQLFPLLSRLRAASTNKLLGWRRTQVDELLAIAGRLMIPKDSSSTLAYSERYPPTIRSVLVEIQQMLDDESRNTYLRIRLLGRRLWLVAVALVLSLILLGFQIRFAGHASSYPPCLHFAREYVKILLLGAVGALISFAVGSMRRPTYYRIYELGSATYATALARVAVGCAGAVVVVSAIQVGLIPVNTKWFPLFAVAAGFSERFVQRIVETLSVSAERSSATEAGPLLQTPERPSSTTA